MNAYFLPSHPHSPSTQLFDVDSQTRTRRNCNYNITFSPPLSTSSLSLLSLSSFPPASFPFNQIEIITPIHSDIFPLTFKCNKCSQEKCVSFLLCSVRVVTFSSHSFRLFLFILAGSPFSALCVMLSIPSINSLNLSGETDRAQPQTSLHYLNSLIQIENS